MMSKLNRSLVMSMVSDIKESVRVAQEMHSRLGRINYPSWRFPTQAAPEVNVMEIVEQHEGTAGELYILLLELAYDRVNLILRFTLEVMEKYKYHSLENNFQEIEYINKSNYMSLGNIVRLIWNRLQTVIQSLPEKSTEEAKGTKENEKDMPRGKVSCGSQARVGNVGSVGDVSGCESCSLASRAIHRLINTIKAAYQQNKLISTAAQERESVRAEIYEKTQWSAMRRLTEAIGRDVNSALAMARRNKAKRERTARNYEQVVRALRDELTEKRNDLERLDAERIENASANFKKLQEEHSEVQRENRQLLKAVEEIRKDMQSLVEGNNALRGQTVRLAESKFVLEKTVEQVRTETSRSELAMQLCLKNMQEEKDTIKTSLEEKIVALEREITELRSVAINDEMEKKLVNDRRDDQRDDCQEETILMPGDDPEVDMTRQLISNRQKIQLLSRQNQRLERTLSRLRKYRTMTDLPSTSNH